MCFLAPSALTYLILKVKQHHLREEIKLNILQGIDPGELMEFTFSFDEIQELEWEHEREFMYQGQSYDVVEKIPSAHGITYRVWWDKAETKIKTQLNALVDKALNGDPSQKENRQKLDQLFKTLYFPSSTFEEDAYFEVKSEHFSEISGVYKSLRWSPPVPPPLAV